MNPLLDAMGSIGSALDTPGAYLRGALAGRPGERSSGRDLLATYGLTDESDPWGGVKGFGAEMVLDPLSLIGPAVGLWKGTRALTGGARALAHADDVNPLLRSVAGMVGDEVGAIGHPQALRMLGGVDTPLGRMNALAQHGPATVSVDPVHQAAFLPGTDLLGQPTGMENAAAVFSPGWRTRGGGKTDPLVIPNLNLDEWGSNRLMSESLANWAREGQVIPKPRPHLDYFPVHELGHAYHDQILNTAADLGHDYRSQPVFKTNPFVQLFGGWEWPGVSPRLRRSALTRLGPRATTNPYEFVAEAFADQVLGQTDLPRMLRGLYRDLGGPDVGMLPPEFWDELRLLPRR